MIHITTNIDQEQNTAVAIGNFDGFHSGHEELIKKIKNITDQKSVIFSFYPHPKTVITGQMVKEIFTKNEKIELAKKIGIDIFIEYPFDLEFAKTTPEHFVYEILVRRLKCKTLVVGCDYKFGKNRNGDINSLEILCKKYNIDFFVLSDSLYNGKKISSSIIRDYIEDGRITEANKMLSKTFFITGKVIKGMQIGRTINFPTANILWEENKLIPQKGVYSTTIKIEGIIYKSITNIGTRPTVNGSNISIETHILDFDEDIYHKEVVIYFEKKIRDEKKFSSLEDLKEQIAKDVASRYEYSSLTFYS